MRVLFDINFVLDILLKREPWEINSTAALYIAADRDFTVCFAVVSLPTLFYLAQKFKSREKAFEALERCLSIFEIVVTNEAIARSALIAHGSDYEDDLVAASAAAAGCDGIVTRDATFPRGVVEVWTPGEFVQQFRSQV